MNEETSNRSGDLTNLQAADLYRMQVRELRNYAMFMLDPRGIITSWNSGVEQLLGYSEKGLCAGISGEAHFRRLS